MAFGDGMRYYIRRYVLPRLLAGERRGEAFSLHVSPDSWEEFMTTKRFTVSGALVVAMLAVVFCQGCTDVNMGLSSSQQADMQRWQADGVDRVVVKDTETSSYLGLVFGVGSFTTGQPVWGVVDLLLWPLSCAWDPVLAAQNANRINYEATRVAWEKQTGQVAVGGAGGIACDVRIVRVSDASVVASASERGSPGRLEAMATVIADELKDDGIKGGSITVATLRDRGGTAKGRAVADEVADKIMGALVKTKWFDVKERIDLTSILSERDLESAQLVKNPEIQKKLAGITYIVIGGVSAGGS